MEIVNPSAELVAVTPNALEIIEEAGRVCYRSIGPSPETFVKRLIDRRHESVLEHASATIKFVCDRGVSHELVRHRLASYCQESTRYCNYSGGLEFVKPCFFREGGENYRRWLAVMREAEKVYIAMISSGARAEEARSVLPNSLRTVVVVTANFRQWRHMFCLRCGERAHPQMREVMVMARNILRRFYPVVFGDAES